MYKLIVIWDSGEKEEATYETIEKAKEIEKGFRMAFGKQVQWTGIRKEVQNDGR